MSDFRMPSLGADMEGGILIEWLKEPGDLLHRGDVIAVVETEKGAIEIEVFEDGVLDKLVTETGQKLAVGELMAVINGGAEPAPSPLEPPAVPSIEPSAKPSSTAPRPAAPAPTRRRVSPAARRHAQDLGIDVEAVTGTGPHGAITVDDVERAAKPAREPAQASASMDRDAMRHAIGAAMARANREIPHYYVSATLDLEPLISWLSQLNETLPVAQRVLYAAPLIKAVSLALRDSPMLNGHWIDDRFQPSEEVHVGTAIAVRGGGLVSAAIHNTDQLDLAALMAALKDLTNRVRKGRMKHSELAGGTFTVTNLGEGSVDMMLPIISPPQVGIVAFGSIAERPWVVDGQVLPRRVITATLGADHRCSDGRTGAKFLERLVALLKRPDAL